MSTDADCGRCHGRHGRRNLRDSIQVRRPQQTETEAQEERPPEMCHPVIDHPPRTAEPYEGSIIYLPIHPTDTFHRSDETGLGWNHNLPLEFEKKSTTVMSFDASSLVYYIACDIPASLVKKAIILPCIFYTSHHQRGEASPPLSLSLFDTKTFREDAYVPRRLLQALP